MQNTPPPPEGSLKVSGYAKGTAGRVLTAGVIEQHDVVQGDVALPLLGNGRLKDHLRRTKGQVKELINEGEGPQGVGKSNGFLQFTGNAWKVDTLITGKRIFSESSMTLGRRRCLDFNTAADEMSPDSKLAGHMLSL